MFTAEERTKFFDFIIPVVPYIHKGNAYDYMAELFADDIKDERNKKFLIKVSLFIDNSRLIKNIANEYYIYNKFIKLNDREPHTKFIKLLSLIIYKNLFPKDFNKLYFNKGYLAELFNKEEFAKQDEINLDNLKYKTIKECIDLNEDSNKFFKAPQGYDYIYNGGYFNLIKFLVKDGYIDETYKDYMSAITENSLTYEERAFLQNIAAHNGKQFLLPLERIKEEEYLNNLLTFIDEKDFNRIEILNINLMKELMYYDEIHIYKAILSSQRSTLELYNFLIILYSEIDYKPNEYYYNLVLTILLEEHPSLFIDKNIINVIITIINNHINDLINNKSKIYKKFTKVRSIICNDNKYLKYLNDNLNQNILFIKQNNTHITTKEVIDLFYQINITFNNINLDLDNKLIGFIIDRNMFVVNYNNIQVIAKYYNSHASSCNMILTFILKLNNKKLQSYILKSFDILIDSISRATMPKIYDESIYDEIINHPQISEYAKNLFSKLIQKEFI